jgi:hypothetical protein
VLKTGRAHTMTLKRYDVQPSGTAVPFRRKYWIPVNTPLLDENGHIAAILHHVEDVTPAASLLRAGQPEQGPHDLVRALAIGAARLQATATTLDRRGARLGDALTAMAAARTTVHNEVGFSYRARLWRLLAKHVDDSPWKGWTHAVCVTAVESLDTVDAAGYRGQ